ncbi:MAG: hypothetical protein RQ748_01405 [Elusimicrobiales bacterium]|nr:hypothetical protein [Elusimicrobiales bacterium]
MNYLLDLYVLHLIGLLAALSLATEAVGRRGGSVARLRLAWNWFLLVSLAVCALTGFGLFVPMEKETSRLIFRLHLWTGAACAWAGFYHAALRARAMLPARPRGRK